MALAGLIDVSSDERRPHSSGQALRINLEPQF